MSLVDHVHQVHIVGIGGAGMSALASLLLESGRRVTGSDLKESAVLERLRLLGAQVYIGHAPSYVEGADLVAYSSAIAGTNVELVAARAAGIPTATRAQLLVALTEGRQLIAVSGTHGKTTTTSMIGLSLAQAGYSPSYVIGAELNEAGASGHFGTSNVMVVEADESDGTFLELDPSIAVITNVEPDHLDYYGDFDHLRQAFGLFARRSHLPPVLCIEDPFLATIAQEIECRSYGFSEAAVYQIKNVSMSSMSTAFELFEHKRRLGSVELSVLGLHNILNATAAIAAAASVGVALEEIAPSLSRYLGVARRFQHRRVLDSVRIIDDYAHLPSELVSTIAAARQLGARRVVAVFQPHRYSRTHSIARELGEALAGADVAVVTDVYAAGEDPIPGVSGALVYEAAREILGDRAHYCASRHELASVVRGLLEPDDVCLTLGAGDITMLDTELVDVW
ncbi:UDP-N-acetylmuramate--L-alanine ligase [Ferrimicrobium sp.]|jgi:UDP-N-acetylmuramate--alanine ligase|uniref:UDP-N-acetylmuramate--L-alanine ligase n=1 Tax=Ferrimicrobium sp. TaxID=2926050 RepID=UPI002633C1CD|nr:UDP-N-acetylmuramate--L-alanine ligase [Ferrimicrobium sp.]MCL5973332.1 UDP-N-acetylmuramate--L-alanine ligase [Actinomycetota bacterium]